MVPRPFQEETAPKPSAISCATSAPAALAPLPSQSIGRFARARISAASSSAASEGGSGGGTGSTSVSSAAGRGISTRCRSIGISTETGPIGGVSASVAARTSVPKASAALRTRCAALPTAASIAVCPGTSCTVPVSRSMNFVAVWPVMCSTGEPAKRASTSPGTALAAPGPVEEKITPSPPETRA